MCDDSWNQLVKRRRKLFDDYLCHVAEKIIVNGFDVLEKVCMRFSEFTVRWKRWIKVQKDKVFCFSCEGVRKMSRKFLFWGHDEEKVKIWKVSEHLLSSFCNFWVYFTSWILLGMSRFIFIHFCNFFNYKFLRLLNFFRISKNFLEMPIIFFKNIFRWSA